MEQEVKAPMPSRDVDMEDSSAQTPLSTLNQRQWTPVHNIFQQRQHSPLFKPRKRRSPKRTPKVAHWPSEQESNRPEPLDPILFEQPNSPASLISSLELDDREPEPDTSPLEDPNATKSAFSFEKEDIGHVEGPPISMSNVETFNFGSVMTNPEPKPPIQEPLHAQAPVATFNFDAIPVTTVTERGKNTAKYLMDSYSYSKKPRKAPKSILDNPMQFLATTQSKLNVLHGLTSELRSDTQKKDTQLRLLNQTVARLNNELFTSKEEVLSLRQQKLELEAKLQVVTTELSSRPRGSVGPAPDALATEEAKSVVNSLQLELQRLNFTLQANRMDQTTSNEPRKSTKRKKNTPKELADLETLQQEVERLNSTLNALRPTSTKDPHQPCEQENMFQLHRRSRKSRSKGWTKKRSRSNSNFHVLSPKNFPTRVASPLVPDSGDESELDEVVQPLRHTDPLLANAPPPSALIKHSIPIDNPYDKIRYWKLAAMISVLVWAMTVVGMLCYTPSGSLDMTTSTPYLDPYIEMQQATRPELIPKRNSDERLQKPIEDVVSDVPVVEESLQDRRDPVKEFREENVMTSATDPATSNYEKLQVEQDPNKMIVEEEITPQSALEAEKESIQEPVEVLTEEKGIDTLESIESEAVDSVIGSEKEIKVPPATKESDEKAFEIPREVEIIPTLGENSIEDETKTMAQSEDDFDPVSEDMDKDNREKSAVNEIDQSTANANAEETKERMEESRKTLHKRLPPRPRVPPRRRDRRPDVAKKLPPGLAHLADQLPKQGNTNQPSSKDSEREVEVVSEKKSTPPLEIPASSAETTEAQEDQKQPEGVVQDVRAPTAKDNLPKVTLLELTQSCMTNIEYVYEDVVITAPVARWNWQLCAFGSFMTYLALLGGLVSCNQKTIDATKASPLRKFVFLGVFGGLLYGIHIPFRYWKAPVIEPPQQFQRQLTAVLVHEPQSSWIDALNHHHVKMPVKVKASIGLKDFDEDIDKLEEPHFVRVPAVNVDDVSVPDPAEYDTGSADVQDDGTSHTNGVGSDQEQDVRESVSEANVDNTSICPVQEEATLAPPQFVQVPAVKMDEVSAELDTGNADVLGYRPSVGSSTEQGVRESVLKANVDNSSICPVLEEKTLAQEVLQHPILPSRVLPDEAPFENQSICFSHERPKPRQCAVQVLILPKLTQISNASICGLLDKPEANENQCDMKLTTYPVMLHKSIKSLVPDARKWVNSRLQSRPAAKFDNKTMCAHIQASYHAEYGVCSVQEHKRTHLQTNEHVRDAVIASNTSICLIIERVVKDKGICELPAKTSVALETREEFDNTSMSPVLLAPAVMSCPTRLALPVLQMKIDNTSFCELEAAKAQDNQFIVDGICEIAVVGRVCNKTMCHEDEAPTWGTCVVPFSMKVVHQERVESSGRQLLPNNSIPRLLKLEEEAKSLDGAFVLDKVLDMHQQVITEVSKGLDEAPIAKEEEVEERQAFVDIEEHLKAVHDAKELLDKASILQVDQNLDQEAGVDDKVVQMVDSESGMEVKDEQVVAAEGKNGNDEVVEEVVEVLEEEEDSSEDDMISSIPEEHDYDYKVHGIDSDKGDLRLEILEIESEKVLKATNSAEFDATSDAQEKTEGAGLSWSVGSDFVVNYARALQLMMEPSMDLTTTAHLQFVFMEKTIIRLPVIEWMAIGIFALHLFSLGWWLVAREKELTQVERIVDDFDPTVAPSSVLYAVKDLSEEQEPLEEPLALSRQSSGEHPTPSTEAEQVVQVPSSLACEEEEAKEIVTEVVATLVDEVEDAEVVEDAAASEEEALGGVAVGSVRSAVDGSEIPIHDASKREIFIYLTQVSSMAYLESMNLNQEWRSIKKKFTVKHLRDLCVAYQKSRKEKAADRRL